MAVFGVIKRGFSRHVALNSGVLERPQERESPLNVVALVASIKPHHLASDFPLKSDKLWTHNDADLTRFSASIFHPLDGHKG